MSDWDQFVDAGPVAWIILALFSLAFLKICSLAAGSIIRDITGRPKPRRRGRR